MKTIILASTLALAALGLAACGSRPDAAPGAANETLTLNEDADATLGNGDDHAIGNATAATPTDNAAESLVDNTLDGAAGNGL